MATVLMPLPDRDFDVTEVAVPWKLLTRAGHTLVVSRPSTAPSPRSADPLLLEGVLFGAWAPPPSHGSSTPRWSRLPTGPSRFPGRTVDVTEYDGLLLPGGHAPGMRQYLGETVHASQVAAVLGARTARSARSATASWCWPATRRADGRSVLHGRRTTCLPGYIERTAYLATAWRRGRYYRTYPEYVEDEVRAALARPGDFERGPVELSASWHRHRRPARVRRRGPQLRLGAVARATPTCSPGASLPGCRTDGTSPAARARLGWDRMGACPRLPSCPPARPPGAWSGSSSPATCATWSSALRLAGGLRGLPGRRLHAGLRLGADLRGRQPPLREGGLGAAPRRRSRTPTARRPASWRRCPTASPPPGCCGPSTTTGWCSGWSTSRGGRRDGRGGPRSWSAAWPPWSG